VHLKIRDAAAGDASDVADLFYNTVLNVNVVDYSVVQVEARAGSAPEPEMWEERIAADSGARRMFVATHDGRVVGFAELERDGHLRYGRGRPLNVLMLLPREARFRIDKTYREGRIYCIERRLIPC
jgi:hypothetical protein